MNDKQYLTFQKNVDCNNKMIIPKIVVDKFGKQFYMIIKEDEIILKPINKKED